jgi:hypothetical protein
MLCWQMTHAHDLRCRELQMQQQECVRYIIQLEQWLMEGAYNKVLIHSS